MCKTVGHGAPATRDPDRPRVVAARSVTCFPSAGCVTDMVVLCGDRSAATLAPRTALPAVMRAVVGQGRIAYGQEQENAVHAFGRRTRAPHEPSSDTPQACVARPYHPRTRCGLRSVGDDEADRDVEAHCLALVGAHRFLAEGVDGLLPTTPPVRQAGRRWPRTGRRP